MKKRIIIFSAICISGVLAFGQTKTININCSNKSGTPKNLLGVNIGPDNSVMGYKECGINEIRTHDYYGPCDYWTYTMNALDTTNECITTAFNPSIPSSYIWIDTDNKTDSIVNIGATPFFRLGISWPYSSIVPTFPPIDANHNTFSKFAGICKHTVKHFTAGWDNGRYYQIPYWEIWNEPDLAIKFWNGLYANPNNYYKMYKTIADTLKYLNPQLKIGGPGLAYGSMFFSYPEYREDFIAYCQFNNEPLDFYSFHLYDAKNPFAIKAYGDTIRNILNNHGFNNSEIFITEIHPDLKGTTYNNKPKGAAWIASAFITCNNSNIDKFFWYRGTVLAALVDADSAGQSKLRWNGYAYKAYSYFLNACDTLITHNNDEFISSDFTTDTNSLLTLAGISTNNDTLCFLISNLKTAYTEINLNMDAIPWNGASVLEQYTIKSPNDKFKLITFTPTISSNTLTFTIPNALSPSVYLIKLFLASANKINTTISSDETLQINPNPANHFITIKSNNSSSDKVYIYSVTGKLMLVSLLINSSATIDIQHFPDGLYVVTDGSNFVKFSKTKDNK